MTKSILIVGVGGQGTLLTGRIIGSRAMEKGIDVKMSEVHGMAQRGGSVVMQVKYGDKVHSPLVELGEADIIFACGPMPMLRALKQYAAEKQIPAYISLEERMACGVGACLGCVVKTREVDHHSHVKNARICTDGPVYIADDVEI